MNGEINTKELLEKSGYIPKKPIGQKDLTDYIRHHFTNSEYSYSMPYNNPYFNLINSISGGTLVGAITGTIKGLCAGFFIPHLGTKMSKSQLDEIVSSLTVEVDAHKYEFSGLKVSAYNKVGDIAFNHSQMITFLATLFAIPSVAITELIRDPENLNFGYAWLLTNTVSGIYKFADRIITRLSSKDKRANTA